MSNKLSNIMTKFKSIYLLFIFTCISNFFAPGGISAASETGRESVEVRISLLINEPCLTCPTLLDYEKLRNDLREVSWFGELVRNSSKQERKSIFTAWDLLTSSNSTFAENGLAASEDVVKALAKDLRANPILYSFFRDEFGVGVVDLRVRAWQVARQYTDPTDVSLLTRLANDMEARPNLASVINTHTDPTGAFSIWNRASQGERFIPEVRFYNVMDEVVPLAFPHNCSSGLKVYANIPDDTYLIGNFANDGEAIMGHFSYPEIAVELELLSTVAAEFPLPAGQKFNMLNVSMDLHDVVKFNTSGNWPGAGGFFTKINGPWIASASSKNRPVLVISDRDLYRLRPDGTMSAFGKEMRDLENTLNYSFDPSDISYKPN